jgi:hypothetical protein
MANSSGGASICSEPCKGIIPQVENPVDLVSSPVKRSQFEVAARLFILSKFRPRLGHAFIY